jgi:hypothetical protein
LVVVAFVLAGCGASHSASSVTPTSPPATSTTSPATTPAPTPHSTRVVIGAAYAVFVRNVCKAFSHGDAQTLIGDLPYYQYNSGLRYGQLGDGLGETGDPSLMRTWLSAGKPHCVRLTPDRAGHGTLLTTHWKTNAPAALLDLDTFNGHWKINDFTFGTLAALGVAMHTSTPILAYRG